VRRRWDEAGRLAGDLLALASEAAEGEPLLEPAMRGGRRLPQPTLEDSRSLAAASLRSLPDGLRDLGPVPEYLPTISDGLVKISADLAAAGR
jgi:nicotinate phosphoribosyltransferase